ncbi:hypothetical protein BJ741DRAFT_672273 [Chytriomyces cf. hyalinus JEL632]|nr:hypothetical protein BJ741DRAFT_672273 [Chytriomyces cf. hyalinus JEL632]
MTTRRVVHAIVAHFKDHVISLPKKDDLAAWSRMEQLFQKKKGLSGFCLAIDGVHTPILQPPDDPWKSYINRKGYASLAFQVMVDAEASIRYVPTYS